MCSMGQITVASIDDKVELEATDVSDFYFQIFEYINTKTALLSAFF